MIGGYSLVAQVLNERIKWPDHRTVTRQHVEGWVRRRTRNAAGKPPPGPVRANPSVRRGLRAAEWDTADWVDWVLEGVPAAGGRQVQPELVPGRRTAVPA